MNAKTLIKVAAYLLVYLGVPVAASKVHNETASSVLAILFIFLLIPFAIVQLVDFYRTNDGTTWFGRIFNVVFRVPLALFGLACLVGGGSIIGWVLYNVFVGRQKEYTGPSFVFGLGSFGVGVPLVLYGWYTLRSVARRQEKINLSPEEQAEFDHEEDDEDDAADVAKKPELQGGKQ
ncbi:MAG: hypothetical protein P4N60_10910 [Verrucomicrobiae bacterium]|nr:hypothetical protein [Verrucomicrobiae bacterium]